MCSISVNQNYFKLLKLKAQKQYIQNLQQKQNLIENRSLLYNSIRNFIQLLSFQVYWSVLLIKKLIV